MIDMTGSLWGAWSAMALLLIVPATVGLLLRWAGMPSHGRAILAGLLAGILLGPAIFGRAWPERYERLMVGGIQQRQARDHLIRQQGAEMVALQSRVGEPEILRSVALRHADLRRAAEVHIEQARWRDQASLRWFTFIIAGLILLLAGAAAVRGGDRRQGWVAPITIGLWSAALPGGLAAAAMIWWWERPLAESLLVAAAVSIGPVALAPADRFTADAAELGGARMIQTAGRIAAILALSAAVVAMWFHHAAIGLIFILPLVAILVGWLWPRNRGARHAHACNQSLLLPALAACAMVRVDLPAHVAIWPIIIILLLSGDGRWTGGFIGAMLPGGRAAPRTMRLVLALTAAAPAQLALAAIGIHAGVITASYILPLVLGCALIDLTAPARQSMARRIAKMEEMKPTDQ